MPAGLNYSSQYRSDVNAITKSRLLIMNRPMAGPPPPHQLPSSPPLWPHRPQHLASSRQHPPSIDNTQHPCIQYSSIIMIQYHLQQGTTTTTNSILTAFFQVKLCTSVFFHHLIRKKINGKKWNSFNGHDTIPVTKRTVSKYRRKLALLFLHSPPDSWRKWHWSLYIGSLTTMATDHKKI